ADATADSQTATASMTVMADTTTTVSTAPSPSVFGQGVVVTATVTSTVGGTTPATPTGTVQFKDGGSNLGAAVPLTNGVATATVSTLTPGPHTITADYSGDTNFTLSTGTLSGGQQVNPAATTTGLQSAPNPSVFGQGVTVTATVTSTVVGTITGTVQFA